MPHCEVKLMYGDGRIVECPQPLEAGERTCYLHGKYILGLTQPCEETSINERVVAIIFDNDIIEYEEGASIALEPLEAA